MARSSSLNGLPSSLRWRISIISCGRTRLPTWVVSMRWLLRFIGLSPYGFAGIGSESASDARSPAQRYQGFPRSVKAKMSGGVSSGGPVSRQQSQVVADGVFQRVPRLVAQLGARAGDVQQAEARESDLKRIEPRPDRHLGVGGDPPGCFDHLPVTAQAPGADEIGAAGGGVGGVAQHARGGHTA